MPTQLMVIVWGAAIAMVVLAAAIDAVIRARRLRRQRTLDDLRALSWQQFEEVIADAFRRHGYRVQETGGRGTADGGVDHVLTRDRERTLVQAKHWRSQRVGVTLVRELYGVQRAMQAEHSMFVAVGTYTPDAAAFAAQVAMTLVDGDELLRIIAAGLDGEPLELPQPDASATPACPECGMAMVRRMARRGPNAGGVFWGCSTFPMCRGTVPIHEDAAAAG
jgi:restriction system protein